jgi:2-oxoglutarate ferredoxin oxidoreductase subunit delta
MTQPGPAPREVSEKPKGKPKEPPQIQVRVSWCKGCGLCVDYCNLGVLEMDGALPRVVDAAKCSRCMLCEAICPDFAIRVVEPPAESGSGGDSKP